MANRVDPDQIAPGLTGSVVIKKNSCSNSAEHEIFFLLINVKMPTIVGVLTFMSWKNSIIGLFEHEKKAEFLDIFILITINFHVQLS